MLQFQLSSEPNSDRSSVPHILELLSKKNASIQLNSFPEKIVEGFCIYFIIDGRFEWKLDLQSYTLYPGEVFLALPGQKLGSVKGILDLGSFMKLELDISISSKGELLTGRWSNLAKAERSAIGNLLSLNKNPQLTPLNRAGEILTDLITELRTKELAYITRTNLLLDELIITIVRNFSKRNNPTKDFSMVFANLEKALRQDLSHQWTVDEMAAIAGMGSTLLYEKVKNYTGFTPISYLINIRISEAIKLLKKKETSITDIALETGFYSSQHFSTTFKKLIGYTPGEFRKNSMHNQ